MKLNYSLLILAIIPIMSLGQIYVTGNRYGIDCRDILVANIIVHAFPKDSVEKWLENKAFMTITVSTDTSGYLKNILKIRSKKIHISPQALNQCQKYWIESEVRIPASYWDPNINETKHVELGIQEIRENARNGCDTIIQTIGFPPECLYSKVCYQTDSCNRLDLFKREIDIFLEQVPRE